MKFRVRLLVLACAACFICLMFLLFEPKFIWNERFDEMDNDYVEVDADILEDSDRKLLKTTKHDIWQIEKKNFPFSVEANIFNASSREAMIQRFLTSYSVNWDFKPKVGIDLWEVAGSLVTSNQIHGEHFPELGAILTAMSSKSIISADVGHKGTQLKLTLVLDGGQSVVFKPQWYDRNFVIKGKPYDGHDRHTAEILAFHLNRLFNYRRVPLTVGRVVDLEKEILPVATERLKVTFFKNGSDTCFYGKCLYCKGVENGVCANGTLMEGAVILMLPKRFQFQKYRHPWGRTYIDGRKARWEYDDHHYCADVQKMGLYSSGRLLLDIIDACVFDYIIGNADRHHFEVFQNESDSMLIMFDSGKSFGNPYLDEESILAPLKQCKRIRYSTVQRMRQLRRGVLSSVLNNITSHDQLMPLVTSHHFRAMERRLEYIVRLVEKFTETDSNILVDGPSR